MDTATVTAVISAGTAVVVVALTNYFAKGREHEADWRKMKLERYREYILALSGIVGEGVASEAQARHSDAVNGLQLVAPLDVLLALDAFNTHVLLRKSDSAERHDQLLSTLIRSMRQDLQPAYKGKDESRTFRLMGRPPLSNSQ